MEHIEQAGVHSGDSCCALPPYSLSTQMQDQISEQMKKLALELGVVGLMNAQFAIQNNTIYILEVNPRASRTVPFVSKATGVPLSQIAARCMVGVSLASQKDARKIIPPYFSVKAPVFPFDKFLNVDPILGPEMKSTGEVMGVGHTFAQAYMKAKLATGTKIKKGKRAFISVREGDKHRVIDVAKRLRAAEFELVATRGTARA